MVKHFKSGTHITHTHTHTFRHCIQLFFVFFFFVVVVVVQSESSSVNFPISQLAHWMWIVCYCIMQPIDLDDVFVVALRNRRRWRWQLCTLSYITLASSMPFPSSSLVQCARAFLWLQIAFWKFSSFCVYKIILFGLLSIFFLCRLLSVWMCSPLTKLEKEKHK